MAKSSVNDGDAPSIEDHLALQGQVEELKAALAKLTGAQASPSKPVQAWDHDIDTYDQGEFEHRATGEKFKLKYVPDDQHGRPFHFKNEASTFQAATPAELDEHFVGNFSKWKPTKPPGSEK